MSKKHITARGVRVHNLKNIDVKIPLNSFTVITGVSGSGKSSLAFDTLYAEGQRRYVESFSAYARQFLERIDKPDADHIEGIPAAIALEQKNPVKNRRSTVGTATEINDYLRILFSKIGRTYCSRCNDVVRKYPVTDVVSDICSLKTGSRILILFPVEIKHRCELTGYLPVLRENGVVRILVNGKVIDISGAETADELFKTHKIRVRDIVPLFGVIGRMTIKDNMRERATDAVETAYNLGNGYAAIATVADDPNMTQETSPVWMITHKYSRYFVCNRCGIEYQYPEPQLFSFNNPMGACNVCHGFGNTTDVDIDLVVPDKNKSIRDGAIAPWNTPKFLPFKKELITAAPAHDIPLDVPFNQLSNAQARLIIDGADGFYGISDFFRKLEKKKYKMHVRVLISKYRGYKTCRSCSGARLNTDALHVTINGSNIADACAMNIGQALDFFSTLTLSDYEREISSLILNEITKRLGYMARIGLGYLTLDRLTRTLSGGEAQRVNLTTSLGSSLVNTLYILDEPSIGLHARDTGRLIWILNELRDIGNTVIVVEHDREIINASDTVIDMGPEAGEMGGNVVFQGDTKGLSVSQIKDNPASLTLQYLTGKRHIAMPKGRRRLTKKGIVVKGASLNNLKGIDVRFPLNMFICVTGVSGSGKSTLVVDTLYNGIKNTPGGRAGAGEKYTSISGVTQINDIILADQSPIGKTPRSNPVTYIKVFDEIRRLFAATRQALAMKKGAGHFSFNVPGGRCESCDGSGQEKIEMQFLADIYVTCEYCQGKRFRKDILDIKYKGKSIYDVLNMTVDQAVDLFSDSARISSGLQRLRDTGLGYLRLGQSATTLSGGEAQRLKLATFMAKGATDKTLFIFDEPTTGLHFHDIDKLLQCFDRLVEAGHSIIVIEHNIDVIKYSDYVIDLGPEGGDNGGFVVQCGTPEEIAQCKSSHTGRYLR